MCSARYGASPSPAQRPCSARWPSGLLALSTCCSGGCPSHSWVVWRSRISRLASCTGRPTHGGSADLPVIGPRILVPFRVHHLNPDDFLRRTFLDTNGDVAALAILPMLAVLWIPLDARQGQALALAGWGFCAMGAMTNQIHQWAHMPTPPRAVAVLQAVRLVLRPDDHARHHGRPYDGAYCITTGWCNRSLEAVAFFRRLEDIVTRVTGGLPRHDEQQGWSHRQTTQHDGARDV